MTALPKLKLEQATLDFKKASERNLTTDKIASYLSRVTNHEDLFKIGKSFMSEYNKGVKNFAITSTGYKNSQQRTILGLCCYFDYVDQYRIAIISDHLRHGIFDDFVKESTLKQYQLEQIGGSVNYFSYQHHFDFIEYSEIMRIYDQHLYSKTFDFEMKSVLDFYDIILWDVPDLDKMKLNLQFHYRISHFYESLTMIVSPNASSGKRVEMVKKFFNNFNVNLSGILFESSSAIDQPKRKKILGII